MDEIERCILVKPEVFVYNIPPRQSARGYRAADWNLASPDWTGRLRCVTRGGSCEIRLEDKTKGELFATCPVEQYPGLSVEAVTDSSRYFVICVQDSGRKAYIGIGFTDRSDSFDLNVALQDHFNDLKRETEIAKESNTTAPKLDLAFKEGQTIRINIPGKGAESGFRDAAAKGRSNSSTAASLLPVGGAAVRRIAPPPGATNLTPMQSPSDPNLHPVIGAAPAATSDVELLGNDVNVSRPQPTAGLPDDPWGDFASAPASKQSGNWETF